MKNRIGCFGRCGQIDEIVAAGYDSAELDILELSAMTAGEFGAFVRKAHETGLGFEAFSGFMPLSERICSEDFDWAYYMEHAKRAAERTGCLGARLWPFGAGKCRSLPEDTAQRPAMRNKVMDFVGELCDVLLPYGILLAVEPLGPANSNFLNRITETAEFVAALRRPNCFAMCDLRHILKSGDSYAEIQVFRQQIIHAHIDYPLGDLRFFPRNGDGFDYLPYLKALVQAGYTGLLTVEATAYQNFGAEAGACRSFLAELCSEVRA